MKRNTYYHYVLLFAILLISVSLYGCGPNFYKMQSELNSKDKTVSSTENNTTDQEDPSYPPDKISNNTTSNTPNTTDIQAILPIDSAVSSDETDDKVTNPVHTIKKGETLKVKGSSVSLGESKDSVLKKFGSPNRTLETEYDFDYYVYNNDYRKLVFIAIRDNKVVGFYTDSIDFSFQGISYGSELSTVNNSLKKNFTLSEVLTVESDSNTLRILMDKIGTQKVVGIYLLDNKAKEDEYTDTVMKNIELMVYDLTNSIRARNQVSLLSWSTSAALSSRKHSKDMAENNFFDHINLKKQHPGERMREEGISYSIFGENIIAGYGTAIISSHGWLNSSGHRKNLLNPEYRNMGVGFVYDEESHYKTYITQNFYR